jgi:hypothetical protein
MKYEMLREILAQYLFGVCLRFPDKFGFNHIFFSQIKLKTKKFYN